MLPFSLLAIASDWQVLRRTSFAALDIGLLPQASIIYLSQLRFDLMGSPSLPEGVRQRAAALAGSRLTSAGEIVITASRRPKFLILAAGRRPDNRIRQARA